MPHRTRIAALLATVALLAAPGLALAQSGGAGDQQYQDPFSGQQNGSGGSKGSSGSSGSSSGSGLSQSAPSSSSSGTTAAPATSASGAVGTSAQSGQLAHTGIDLRLVAGVGMLLLVAGIALRRSGHARR